MGDNKQVGFAINNFRIKQFASIPGFDGSEEEYQLSLQVGFSVDETKKTIGNTIEVSFLAENNTPFIIASVEGLFDIDPASWDNIFNEDKSAFVIPKNMGLHLSVITTGATRGVILTKILDTAPEYAAFILPTIDLTQIITDDTVLPILSLSEEE